LNNGENTVAFIIALLLLF